MQAQLVVISVQVILDPYASAQPEEGDHVHIETYWRETGPPEYPTVHPRAAYTKGPTFTEHCRLRIPYLNRAQDCA